MKKRILIIILKVILIILVFSLMSFKNIINTFIVDSEFYSVNIHSVDKLNIEENLGECDERYNYVRLVRNVD